VTNYGILPHRIKDSTEGIIVNADVNSLARGIKHALSNVDSFRVLEIPYTWSNAAEKLLAIYKEF
jgi:hypothetical protein